MGDSSKESIHPQDSENPIGSAFSPVLRSKGLLWLDNKPDFAFSWNHAGRDVNFSMLGPWPPSIPQSKGGFGQPRTELVFIGAGVEEAALRAVLDSCLVSSKDTMLSEGV